MQGKPAVGLNNPIFGATEKVKPPQPDDLVYLSRPTGIVNEIEKLKSFSALAESLPANISKHYEQFKEPTLLQQTSIPLLLKEQSLIVRSSVGMGILTCIEIAVFAHLRAHEPREGYTSIREVSDGPADRKHVVCPRIIIITGAKCRMDGITANLKQQLRGHPWRIFSLHTAHDIQRQYEALTKYGADIIIAKADALHCYMQRNLLDMSSLEAIFVDEADQIIAVRLSRELEQILQNAMHARRFVFAENFPAQLQELIDRFLPQTSLRLEVRHIPDVQHTVEMTPLEGDKIDLIERLMENKTINTETRAVVFVSKKTAVRHIFDQISVASKKYGIYTRSLAGAMDLNMRDESARVIRNGGGKILIMQDSFAWMLGTRVDVVINFDLPENLDGLTMRGGFTGAVGKKGKIITLIDELTHPITAKKIVQMLKDSKQPVRDELVALSERSNAKAPESGTRSTYEWIKRGAMLRAEEEAAKKASPPVQTFVRHANRRGTASATSTPRSGKAPPKISF